MKDGVKRPALNDKPTFANRALARDDANTQGKPLVNTAVGEKILVQPFQKKANVLNQPAQRPQGIAALKDKTNTILQSTLLVPLKDGGEEKEKPSLMTATQKLLSRRNTMANFKDYSGAPIEKPLIHPQKPLPFTTNPLPSTNFSTTTTTLPNTSVPLAPVHRDLNTKPSKKVLNTVDEELSTITKAASQGLEVTDMTRNVVPKPITISGAKVVEAALDVKKINVALDSVDALKKELEDLLPKINVEDHGSGILATSKTSTSLIGPFPATNSSESTLASTNALLTELVAAQNAKLATSETLTAADRVSIYLTKSKGNISEPEEYWDEPSEPENFDDEGFVTARSAKSTTAKVDGNTTGNATTVLVPKMNAKIRRELEAAAKVIESMKTVEDIEDEAWDTTMVAEYGDEIFQHMKHLEVCFFSFLYKFCGSRLGWTTFFGLSCLCVGSAIYCMLCLGLTIVQLPLSLNTLCLYFSLFAITTFTITAFLIAAAIDTVVVHDHGLDDGVFLASGIEFSLNLHSLELALFRQFALPL